MATDYVSDWANSAAGKLLATIGFKATNQGGGLVNFERPVPGEPDRVFMVSSDIEADGYGPIELSEGCLLVTWDANDCVELASEEFDNVTALVAAMTERGMV